IPKRNFVRRHEADAYPLCYGRSRMRKVIPALAHKHGLAPFCSESASESPGLVYDRGNILVVTDPRHRIQSDSDLWFGITWQHQNQPASFQDAMPAGLNRLERRQHSITFRFGSGDGICPAGFYYLSKFRFQGSKPLGVSGFIALDKSLCLAAENA